MRKIGKFVIYCCIGIVATLGILYSVAYLKGEPDLNKNRYIKLYDQNNKLYYQNINDYSGQYVSLDQVSPYFKKSIVAIEDQRFYQHHGFDIKGISRAIKTNIMNQKKSQGASTISQQYARLLYLTNEKTWTRKIKEAFLTMQLETHLSKDEILEGYINNVYFGHGIYGIENAAHYFYNKKAKDLNLNEATILAGVINGPGYYSPLLHPNSAKQRQKLVLKAMVKQKMISKKKCKQTADAKLTLASSHQIQENMSTYYYKDAVIQELKSLGFYHQKYLNKGLNIYTALNPDYQKALNQSIKDQNITSNIQTAFIITQPKTSQIQALVGGKDYNLSQYNRVLKCKRQIGSTMKPFLYYLALENGFNPTTKFMCEPTTFKLKDGTTYAPANFNNKYAYKEITLAQAIAVSDNIYALKTHLFLGTNTLYQFLKDFHFPVKNNASLALGTLSTNIYDLSNAYNTIAHSGQYKPIYTIKCIKDHQGHILYQNKEKPIQKLDQTTCLLLSHLLTGTFNNQFSTYLNATMGQYHLDFPVACKTGSTDYDNLIVGYTPDILITGWSGYDDNQKIINDQEKQFVKNIFIDMMKHSATKKKPTWYKANSHIIKIAINPLTGENDENGIVYWFKKE